MATPKTWLAGVTVSRLGYGTLPLSPLQSSLPAAEGAELLLYAWERGINFWDTAQLYDNYQVLGQALKRLSSPPVIATKTYAYTAQGAREALEGALGALGLERIDIMLLHEQSAQTLPGHREALNWLIKARDQGQIGALGISTHRVDGVMAALKDPELQIIHPLYNQAGIGIQDGSAQEMALALEQAALAGKGIYAMKVLGGGALFRDAVAALGHAFTRPWLHSVMVGMSTSQEIDYNLQVLEGREPGEELKAKVGTRERRLLVAQWCHGCGNCLANCPQGALTLAEGRVQVHRELCVLCAYCSRACPDMCLKLV